jgi:hypothetical protein
MLLTEPSPPGFPVGIFDPLARAWKYEQAFGATSDAGAPSPQSASRRRRWVVRPLLDIPGDADVAALPDSSVMPILPTWPRRTAASDGLLLVSNTPHSSLPGPGTRFARRVWRAGPIR